MNDKQFERKIAAKGTESLIAHIPTYILPRQCHRIWRAQPFLHLMALSSDSTKLQHTRQMWTDRKSKLNRLPI